MTSDEKVARKKRKYQGPERRAAKRYPSATYADYDIVFSEQHSIRGSRLVPVQDMSPLGMRILSRTDIPPGRILRVGFVTPESLPFIPRKFRPDCQTVWSSPADGGFRVGLRFLDRDYDTQQVFNGLISYSVKRFRNEWWDGINDRRAAHRHKANISCDLTIEPFPFVVRGGEPACPLRNWSTNGMRVRTSKPLKVGDSLKVTFNVPSGVHRFPKKFAVRARVVWVSGRPDGQAYRAGCKFVGMSKRTREEIHAATIDVLITVHGYG